MLTWDPPNERYFHQGLDRGVLYIPQPDIREAEEYDGPDYLSIRNSIATPSDTWLAGTHSVDAGNNTGWIFNSYVRDAPIPWNGLISVDESGSGSSEIIYRDGNIILSDADASDFAASVSAYFFPDELSECLGIPSVAEGMYVDNQKPKRFSLSYRTLIGSGSTGDMFGYQIHLIYNAVASIGTRSRKTLTDTPEMMPFTFDLVCTPVKLTGFRPSAHYILDTRGMNSTQLEDLEGILYGVGDIVGRMPTPTELFEMMNFGLIMRVYDNHDDTYKITGGSQYFAENLDGSYTVTNINAVLAGDDYAITDLEGNTEIFL